MTFLDRVAKRFGYMKTQRVEQPAEWLRAEGAAWQWGMPDGALTENQSDLYRRLSWVQIAISLVAQVAATTEFEVKRLVGEDKEDVSNHPFELLLNRPNPLDSRFELLFATFAFEALTGNAYWWLNRAGEFAEPSEIWVMEPHKVAPIPDGQQYLRGYVYRPDNGPEIALEPWEVVHFRRFNPLNRFIGLSPIEAIATIAEGDLSMQKWNTNYFSKDYAKPAGALAYSDPIEKTEWERMKAETTRQFGGTKRNLLMLQNVGKGGVSWIPMNLSHADMEFLEGRNFNREEIFSIYAPGAASILAVNATEANSKAGKATFLEYAVWPHLVKVAEKISNDLLPTWGENLVCEFEDIRITDRAMLLQEQQAYGQVHTVDEIRQKHYGSKPIGDERGALLPAEIAKGGTGATTVPVDVHNVAAGQESASNNAIGFDATAMASQKALKAAQMKMRKGIMIAFPMPSEIVAALADAQRLLPVSSTLTPASEFHLTLVYLGDTDLYTSAQMESMASAVEEWASTAPPVIGNLNGLGRFQDVATDGHADALYASFDAVDLPKWRQSLIDFLVSRGIVADGEHGFIPHITLGYIPTSAVTPLLPLPKVDLTLDSLWLALGATHFYYPLMGFSGNSAAKAEEIKALKAWLRKRKNPELSKFKAQYLSSTEMQEIAGGKLEEAATEQDFFTWTGKAIRRSAFEDGADKERAAMEREHAAAIDTAFSRLLKKVLPPGTTPENITPDLAVERYKANESILRDAIIEMLTDAALFGAEFGMHWVDRATGARKAVTVGGANWDLINQDVLHWVLGGHGSFGQGYGDSVLLAQLFQTSEASIRTAIGEWITNGLPLRQLVQTLERTVFSSQRAEMIAVTEVTRAFAEGNRAAWRQSGVITRMRWETAADELVCPTCAPLQNQLADLTAEFDGGLFPPAHPRCRCWITPVVVGVNDGN